MPEPNREKWVEISELFYKKTNFPNCLGSIDGKHIRCRNPNNSGSLFYNHKKYFSIVLMAVVDANLNFIFIDVGAYGREADSNVFRQSIFGKKLYTNQLQIPDAVSLPLTENNSQPFVFVADEAFGLHTNLLRPYPGRGLNNTRRIFNYRLSRARRTVECAFGVLANKWNVLHTTILVEPDFCDHIIKACCVLHNFVRKRDGCNYDENIADTAYINYLEGFQGHGRRHINRNGMEIRDNFANYFINQGAVPFQYRTTL
uniref:Putative nuclease HARBI1 n=1 Tax=Schizaphis graminum TaxID=13262 RepID=A0A2S2PHY3_SCHGA